MGRKLVHIAQVPLTVTSGYMVHRHSHGHQYLFLSNLYGVTRGNGTLSIPRILEHKRNNLSP